MTRHKELSIRIHDANVEAGWWTDLETGESLKSPLRRNFGEMLALVHSELSEAWEGYASKSFDQHLPTLRNWHVEIADACIRVYDMLGGCFEEQLVFIPFALDMPDNFLDFEDWLVYAHALLSRALEHWRKSRKIDTFMYLYRFLDACYELADGVISGIEPFNLEQVIEAKLAYNRDRLDHKLEHRKGDEGKKI